MIEGATSSDTPFVCELDAFTDQEARRDQELSALVGEYQEMDELAQGLRFRYPWDEERFVRIAEWITLQRKCCPFLSFRLDVDHGNQVFWLHITGEDGTKAFLRQILAGFQQK